MRPWVTLTLESCAQELWQICQETFWCRRGLGIHNRTTHPRRQRTVASLLWEPAGKNNSVSWTDEGTLALGELGVQLFIEEDGFKRKTQGKALWWAKSPPAPGGLIPMAPTDTRLIGWTVPRAAEAGGEAGSGKPLVSGWGSQPSGF